MGYEGRMPDIPRSLNKLILHDLTIMTWKFPWYYEPGTLRQKDDFYHENIHELLPSTFSIIISKLIQN